MVDKQELKEIPKWIEELENGRWKVIGKYNEYILEEQNGGVIESCEKIAEKTNVAYENLLITRSAVEPKITDAELKEIKGSDYFRLKTAIVHVYGLNDFL